MFKLQRTPLAFRHYRFLLQCLVRHCIAIAMSKTMSISLARTRKEEKVAHHPSHHPHHSPECPTPQFLRNVFVSFSITQKNRNFIECTIEKRKRVDNKALTIAERIPSIHFHRYPSAIERNRWSSMFVCCVCVPVCVNCMNI